MAYRDDVEALRAKISVLEREAQRVVQLEARIRELEAENAMLRGPTEGTLFDVELTMVGPRKINIIKAIRGLFNLGLKEAKELTDVAPTILKQGVAKEEAVEIQKVLEELGAKVTILTVREVIRR